MSSFIRVEKEGMSGMPCLLNIDQVRMIFVPRGQPADSGTCRALLNDGSTAEVLTPFTELEDIIKAAHIARRAEANQILLAHAADLPRHKK